MDEEEVLDVEDTTEDPVWPGEEGHKFICTFKAELSGGNNINAQRAADSAASALASQEAAAASEANAAESEANAAVSARRAAANAAAAAQSERNAAASEEAAALSETNAASRAEAAEASKEAAAESEASAKTSETNAARSAEAAAASETNVEQSAESAAASASAASTSEENAAESARSALTQGNRAMSNASAAAQSARGAAASEENAAQSEASAAQHLADIVQKVEEFEGVRVTATTLEPGSEATAAYDAGALTLGIPRGDKGASAHVGVIADEFSEEEDYVVGNYVINGDYTYRFKADHPAGAWNNAHVDKILIGDSKADVKDTVLETTLSRGRKEGSNIGRSSFAFGENVVASGVCSFASGSSVTATGSDSHAEGSMSYATGLNTHAESTGIAGGDNSHAEGVGTAVGNTSHAEGRGTVARGMYSHAEGGAETQYCPLAGAANSKSYIVGGTFVPEKGMVFTESGATAIVNSFDADTRTVVLSKTLSSEALDKNVLIHKNGIAAGRSSHVENEGNFANGDYSHAEGFGTIANLQTMHVSGSYNVEGTLYDEWVSGTNYVAGKRVNRNGYGYECITPNSDTVFTASNWKRMIQNGNEIFVVGNGTANNDRSNAFKVTADGNGEFQGDVVANGNGGSNPISLVSIGTVQDVSNLFTLDTSYAVAATSATVSAYKTGRMISGMISYVPSNPIAANSASVIQLMSSDANMQPNNIATFVSSCSDGFNTVYAVSNGVALNIKWSSAVSPGNTVQIPFSYMCAGL